MEYYFKINDIKYVIRYDNNFHSIYYKEVNNQLIMLTEEEFKDLEKIRNINKSTIVHSELGNTILNNNNIPDSKEILDIITWIDSIIPDGKKENFYSNLADINFIKQDYQNNVLATYDIKENNILYTSQTSMHDLCHELLHMASSSYDNDNGMYTCGIDDFIGGYRGVTEGITESLANTAIPIDLNRQLSSGYFEQVKECNQLGMLVGWDTMLGAYFGKENNNELEYALMNLGLPKEQAFTLLRNIEENYNNRHLDIEQNLSSSIQNTLLDCLEIKINNMTNDSNYTPLDIQTFINNYAQNIVLPDSFELQGKNPNNYIGLNESVDRFIEIKASYEQQISDQITMNEQSISKVKGFSIILLLCVLVLILLVLFILGFVLI